MNRLDIIYEDQDLIVVHKPDGVAVQTKRLGQQDMESLLKNYRAKKGEQPYIGVVHRLDQPVEGVMVFAKNQKAAADLSRQIQSDNIGKYYYALTYGAPPNHEGILEDYLLTDKKKNVTMVVDAGTKDAKPAKLEYRVVEIKDGIAKIRIRLHTGRQHQIRVQLAHMGCPLIGDTKYGNDGADPQAKSFGLALCSYRLELKHPATGKKLEFEITPNGAVGRMVGENVCKS